MTKLLIDDCMAPTPLFVGKSATMAEAHATMRENRIRHLPVIEDGTLLGLVSIRDLLLMETLQDVDPAKVIVAEAMSVPAYSVKTGTDLREVVLNMHARKYGSAVVVNDEDVVVGVFTTQDALRVLANLLV